DMRVVMTISDRISVLHRGELLAEGAPADIRANPEVQAVYLGATAASPGGASAT
ncbi:MAG TPA: ABC transporter ATP-binding protein, partial [Methylomirabilota bacterium]